MEKLIRFLSSYKASIVLLLIYAIGLATATFIEKWMGAQAAKMLVYYSPLFLFLQFLLVMNFILILFSRNFIQRKKWAMVVIHCALVVILLGALTTFLFGKEGQVHIREGEKTDQMVMHTSKGVKTEILPFVLELKDFRLIRYPGSQSPSSYESDLLVHVDGEVREEKVFMNNVLDVKGYRFFQASYDQDEMGTILSVNRDVAGRTVTYAGYLMLVAGFILIFFMPDSRFRKLQQRLKEVRKGALVTIFVLTAVYSYSQEMPDGLIDDAVQHNRIPTEHAARFGKLPVQFRGRTMPMNTFSSEILRKVHKEQTFGDLNSDQFLLGILAMPQMWMQVPFIVLSDKEVSRRYNLPEEYVPYYHLFDQQGNYRLLPQLQEIYHKPADKRMFSEKELVKLDERVSILYQLLNHTLFGIYPDPKDPSHTWYAPGDDLSAFSETDSLFIIRSFEQYLEEVRQALGNGDWSKADQALDVIASYQLANDKASLIHPKKLEAEFRYNKMDLFNRVKTGYFICGGLLLVIALMQLLREKRWKSYVAMALTVGIMLLFLCHMFGMGMRWYISGYAPWSNSYETMVYVSWATVLAGFIFGRKSTLTRALATLFGGVILFVAALNWMDPQINTLVPVLKSPWLMFHVAVIVAAYGFFGISFLLGITNLSIMAFTKDSPRLSSRIQELSIINNMSLLVGVVLMTTGTFLGAVWANESWGRYWGWDPKETWALITVVVYSMVTHLHLVKKWNNLWLFNLLSVFAFASVLMTFLGVNYFLSGMHSYGQADGVSSVFLYIGIAFAVLGILGIISYMKSEKGDRETGRLERKS
ncbi:Cytochrome C assembly protein [Proteiniphilum saccharofermentans]|uniref:Cytochrome C assembly protein n=1 Tax=Proteiniphilum saccharofermentans TaxID=1642647 RepID=A0A1R3SUS8_9BACT|nr:cytochrome c biogenesis protein CcsA [Proteiniphilum saccharofermentans]SCD20066.1 Cytochrome C assembly protein [Proteiniphilum saccharofermentans]